MPLVFVIHSGGEKMSYINTIDINGVVYNLGSLTDGNHEVNLPQNLKNNDVFLLQGDVVSNLVLVIVNVSEGSLILCKAWNNNIQKTRWYALS